MCRKLTWLVSIFLLLGLGHSTSAATNPYPPDGATDVSTKETLWWYPEYGAMSYDVYFGTSSPPDFIGNQTANNYVPGTLEQGTTYFWRINEIEADGTIYTGDVWSFTTAIEEATNPYPADGATDVPVDVVLSWSPGYGALSHDVYFGTSSPPPWIGKLVEASYDPGTLEPGTTYFWRVNESTAMGPKPGPVWSFTTTSGPEKATNPYPADGAEDVPLNITLSWDPASVATSQDVYFGTSSSPPFVGNQTSNDYNPGTLEPGVDYYWRIDTVRQIGELFIIYTGDVWNFTTESGPEKATNPYPADGTGDVPLDIVLSWNPGSGATSHDVYFGTSSPPPFIGNQTWSDYNPGTLEPGVDYYWRINEVDDHDPNNPFLCEGDLWHFRTMEGPEKASNPYPADGAEDVPLDIVLSWNPGSRATSHDVYFGTSSSPPFIGNQTSSDYDPGTLEPGTTYFWKINEVVPVLEGPPIIIEGDLWNFTTTAGPNVPDSNAPVRPKEFYTSALLKFFILPDPNEEMKKKFTSDYVNQMVKKVNDTYFCQWKNDIIFDWNNKVTVLPKEYKSLSNKKLLRKVRSGPNCTKGINIIFLPDVYKGNWNGWTIFRLCMGVTASPTGGIKIIDTCNQNQMAETLAHELLHAFGLSHQRTKWWPPGAPANGISKDPNLPVPPHAYRFADVDSNCDVNDADDKIDPNKPWRIVDGKYEWQDKAGVWRNGWDVDGDCDVDANDMTYLLWGSKARTDKKISVKQYEYIWKNAKKIPCVKVKSYLRPTLITYPSVSSFSMDDVGDVPYEYIDITASIAINYYDPSVNTCLLTLEVGGNIPDMEILTYGFYLNTDGDTNTGSPNESLPGADFAAILDITPPLMEAKLWKYDGGWVEVQFLNWKIGDIAEDFIGDDFAYEEYVGDAVTIEVPLSGLNLATDGDMQVRPFADDLSVRDLSAVMNIPLKIVYPPLINIEPMSVLTGETVAVYGTDFTPNSNVSIEFEQVQSADATTDENGDFTATFEIPMVPGGYFMVRAADDYDKHDLCMVYVID